MCRKLCSSTVCVELGGLVTYVYKDHMQTLYSCDTKYCLIRCVGHLRDPRSNFRKPQVVGAKQGSRSDRSETWHEDVLGQRAANMDNSSKNNLYLLIPQQMVPTIAH